MQDLSNGTARTNGRWTKEEHLKFLEGLRIYGKNWKKIEQLVETRTGSQIRSHAQKFFLKVKPTPLDSHDSPLSAELHEEPEEPTGNSKNSSEWSLRREDYSYYLGKVFEYTSGRVDIDFWEALVDYRGPTETVQTVQGGSQGSAFSQFGEEGEAGRERSKLNSI